MIKKSMSLKMYITMLLIAFTIMLVATDIFGKGIPFSINIPIGEIKIGVITLASLIGLFLLVAVLMANIFVLKRAASCTDVKPLLNGMINAFDYLSIFICAILVVYLGFILIAFPVTVTQTSMTPTILDTERLLVSTNTKDLQREDIVVFKIDSSKLAVSSSYNEELWLKRVIGLPGEKVEFVNGVLYVNGEAYHEDYLYDENGEFKVGTVEGKSYDCKLDTRYKSCKTLSDVMKLTGLTGEVIPEGYYLLLGDNRANSYDSWSIGLVPEELIVGRAKYKIVTIFTYVKIN